MVLTMLGVQLRDCQQVGNNLEICGFKRTRPTESQQAVRPESRADAAPAATLSPDRRPHAS
jgi:hypothetical protein